MLLQRPLHQNYAQFVQTLVSIVTKRNQFQYIAAVAAETTNMIHTDTLAGEQYFSTIRKRKINSFNYTLLHWPL